MSEQLYNGQPVDQSYSAITVDQLRKETFLQPGLTYNEKYASGNIAAGVVNFYKIAPTAVVSTAPGSKITETAANSSLKSIYISNIYAQEIPVYEDLEQATAPNFAIETFKSIGENIREGWEAGAIAVLKNGGTADTDVTAVTNANAKTLILGAIAKIRKAKAKPSVILVSEDTYSALIGGAITTAVFTPELNDEMVRSGSVGRLFGCSVIPNANVGLSTNTAVSVRVGSVSDAATVVDLSKTDFIVYDMRFFGSISQGLKAGFIEDKDLFGVYARAGVRSGFGVIEPTAVVVHSHA